MSNPCKYEKRFDALEKQSDKISEIHGDVKVLVAEFRAMNGSLRDTKSNQEKHEEESKPYRHKIDIIWSAIHTAKWAIILLFGTGVFWKAFELFIK